MEKIQDKGIETYMMYREKAKQFAEAYKEDVCDHVIDVMASVCMTRDQVRSGGSFSQAVVNNNLLEAIKRADSECSKKLRIITLAKHYCTLEWFPL